MTVIIGFNDCGTNAAWLAIGFAKNNLRADAGIFAGTQHHPPIVRRNFFQQQDLKLPAGFGVDTAQSRRNHARIVQRQHVARSQKIQQGGEPPVFDAVFVSMQNYEARFVPF